MTFNIPKSMTERVLIVNCRSEPAVGERTGTFGL